MRIYVETRLKFEVSYRTLLFPLNRDKAAVLFDGQRPCLILSQNVPRFEAGLFSPSIVTCINPRRSRFFAYSTSSRELLAGCQV